MAYLQPSLEVQSSNLVSNISTLKCSFLRFDFVVPGKYQTGHCNNPASFCSKTFPKNHSQPHRHYRYIAYTPQSNQSTQEQGDVKFWFRTGVGWGVTVQTNSIVLRPQPLFQTSIKHYVFSCEDSVQYPRSFWIDPTSEQLSV